jgi:hypothetical protein
MADEEAVTEETEEVIEDSTINVFDETTDEADADEVKGEEQTEETAESTDESEESESEPPSQNHVPIAALTAERRKRQEAAAKLEHYEEIPDPVENPREYAEFPREYAEFVKAQAEGNSLQDRINLSRSIMVDMDPEYTRYEAEFMAAVSKQGEDGNIEITNQDLFNQFRESPNPAKFARDLGKDILLYKQRSDPDYEQKLRQQWEAEKAVMPDLQPT